MYEFSINLSPGEYYYNFYVNGISCLDDSVDETVELSDGKIYSIIKISEKMKISTPKQYSRVLFSVYAPVPQGVTVLFHFYYYRYLYVVIYGL